MIILPSVSASYFTGSFNDYGVSSKPYNYLKIEAQVQITDASKDYIIYGVLEDSKGNLLHYNNCSSVSSTGAKTFSINFDGIKIYKNKVNGPYTLKYLELSSIANCDGWGMPPEIEQSIIDAYTTHSYSYTDFKRAEPADYCNSSPCIIPSSKISSRDNLNTPEPNSPNTIDNCDDGKSGTYPSTESIESMTITSLNHTFFKTGDTIRADINVNCVGTTDNLNFVYTADKDNPQWQVISQEQCPSAGSKTLSKTFTLGSNAGYHALRGAFDFSLSQNAACAQSNYADNDDVAILVKECNSNSDCAATECDNLDGCYGAKYRNYQDIANTCSQNLCSHISCSSYTEEGDNDADGYSANCGDCNDNNANIHPNAAETCNNIDDDCDSQIDEALTTSCGTSSTGACRYGTKTCSNGQWSQCTGNIDPVAESCNGIDDDCDTLTDEENAQYCITYYRDNDNDAYGQSSNSKCLCSPQDPYDSLQKDDCNDDNTNINPGKNELCNNGLDDDCNSLADNNDPYCFVCTPGERKNCPKQNGVCSGAREKCTSNGQWPGCNDADYLAYNSDYQSTETKCDSLDNDCDGSADEGLTTAYYQDSDSDGYGNPYVSQNKCAKPQGYTADNNDCNDSNNKVSPSVNEICNNGIDDDCDKYIDNNDPSCQGKRELPLVEGWNLISLPKIENNSINEIKKLFSNNFEKIVAVKNNKNYIYDNLNPSSSNLNELSEADGFWINILSEPYVLIDNNSADSTLFHLEKGWNTIGYPSLEEKDINELFHDVMDDINIIYIYQNQFTSFNPEKPTSVQIKPGTGVLIKLKNSAEWYFDGKYTKSYESFALSLSDGWNMVSVPLASDKTSSAIFGSNKLYYLENNKWKSLGENDKINNSYGYWIKSGASSVLIEGSAINNIQFTINKGWNLIGYPLEEEKSPSEYFSNVIGNIESAASFKDGNWKVFNPSKPSVMNSLSSLKPGTGILVRAKSSAVWNFNGSELVAT